MRRVSSFYSSRSRRDSPRSRSSSTRSRESPGAGSPARAAAPLAGRSSASSAASDLSRTVRAHRLDVLDFGGVDPAFARPRPAPPPAAQRAGSCSRRSPRSLLAGSTPERDGAPASFSRRLPAVRWARRIGARLSARSARRRLRPLLEVVGRLLLQGEILDEVRRETASRRRSPPRTRSLRRAPRVSRWRALPPGSAD